jgi:predicted secreted protein
MSGESEAISGLGTSVMRFNGSDYEEIGEVVEVGGPSSSRTVIDVTHLKTVGGFREFIAGLRDSGELALTMNFTREAFLICHADFLDDARQQYKVVFPDEDATEMAFSGLIVGLPLTVPPDDKIVMNVTIKISGGIDVSS